MGKEVVSLRDLCAERQLGILHFSCEGRALQVRLKEVRGRCESLEERKGENARDLGVASVAASITNKLKTQLNKAEEWQQKAADEVATHQRQIATLASRRTMLQKAVAEAKAKIENDEHSPLQQVPATSDRITEAVDSSVSSRNCA